MDQHSQGYSDFVSPRNRCSHRRCRNNLIYHFYSDPVDHKRCPISDFLNKHNDINFSDLVIIDLTFWKYRLFIVHILIGNSINNNNK
jgi:hypothetical protein